MEGNISERLVQNSDRLLLVEYLATELMAARIVREKNPEKKIELKLVSGKHLFLMQPNISLRAALIRQVCFLLERIGPSRESKKNTANTGLSEASAQHNHEGSNAKGDSGRGNPGEESRS